MMFVISCVIGIFVVIYTDEKINSTIKILERLSQNHKTAIAERVKLYIRYRNDHRGMHIICWWREIPIILACINDTKEYHNSNKNDLKDLAKKITNNEE